MRFHFNTGRLYAANGQQIVVDYDKETGVVMFADLARDIDGTFVCEHPHRMPYDVQVLVMVRYDHNEYHTNAASREFLYTARQWLKENTNRKEG